MREDGPCIARPVVHIGDNMLIVYSIGMAERSLPVLLEGITWNDSNFPLRISLNTPARSCIRAKWNPYLGCYETALGRCHVVRDTARARERYPVRLLGNQVREHDALRRSGVLVKEAQA